jgi:diguanylate cyclase (GGDEF)-like protein/PAS domain S-box-containing protein
MSTNIEALFPKLVNLLLDPVFVVDEAGSIVFVSDACEKLLGYTAEEMTGTVILNYIHPEDLEPTLQGVRKVMDGQPHTDYENRYLRKDGGVVHILWSACWYEEEQLRIGVARDITSLRRADQTRNALYRISEAAHAADTLRALCAGVRQVVNELFPNDELSLAFYDAERHSLRVPDWNADHLDGWLERAIESGTPLANVLADGKSMLSGKGDWLSAPLISRDSVLGILTLEKSATSGSFSIADRELLEFVATQVASMVERKQADEELRYLAHHDPLTGLSNRSLFNDRLETALRSARRDGSRLALLYLDLDNFKNVNDRHGHEAGDELIREVARRLQSGTRNSDSIGRMGGDEFTVLLTDISGSEGVVDKAVMKIRDLLAAPLDFNGHTLIASSSIGVATYPEDGETARELMATADTNMYLEKRSLTLGR